MTEATVVHTNMPDSASAGAVLGMQLAEALSGSPDVVVLFSSPEYEPTALLRALKQACHPGILLGCTSSSDLARSSQGLASALALRSTEMQFAVGVGRGIMMDCHSAAQEVVASFQGTSTDTYPYRSALVFMDAFVGPAEDLVEDLTHLTHGTYQFIGGAAGDNAQFRRTAVFCGTEALKDSVVALEILSRKPVGIGIGPDWRPASHPMFVTEAEGFTLVRVEDKPALEVFREHAALTQQVFDPGRPLPFFIKNPIGIDMGLGYKLRVPMLVNDDGSIFCTAEISPRATICLMAPTFASSAEAARRATRAALDKLSGIPPAATLFFDCPASRFMDEETLGGEMEAIREVIPNTLRIGCNSHGQFVRTRGQNIGYFYCTPTVCMIPS